MLKRILIIVAALLVLLPIGAVWFITSTQSGFALLARQLNRLESMGIHTEGVTGTLSGPLHIDRVVIDIKQVYILVEDITVYVNRHALFYQTVGIRSLTAQHAMVKLKRVPDEPDDGKPSRFLPSFLRIAVDRFEIGHGELWLVDAQQSYETSRLAGKARITARELNVFDSEVVMPQLSAGGQVQLLATRPLGLNTKVQATLQSPRDITLKLSAETKGTLEHLTVKAQMLAPSQASVDATLDHSANAWTVRGRALSSDFSLAPWLEQPPVSIRAAQFDFDADGKSNTIRGAALLPEISAVPVTIDARGSFADNIISLSAVRIGLQGSATEIITDGTIGLQNTAAPTLDLHSVWKALQWPLSGANPMLHSSGQLKLSGRLPFAFTATTQLESPDVSTHIPSARGEIAGLIGKTDLTLQRYAIETLGGVARGTGRLQFTSGQDWQLKLDAENLDPRSLFAQFPGAITMSVDASGQGLNSQARFKAQLQKLSGTLRGQPLSGQGVLERNARGWRSDNIALSLGSARLTAQGKYEDIVDLQTTLVASSLKGLWPDLTGQVRFDAHFSGKPAAPDITGTLHGANLRYQDLQSAALDVHMTLHIGNKTQHSSLQIDAQRAGQGDFLMQSVRVTGDGTMAQHQISVSASAMPRSDETTPWSIEAALSGKYDNRNWSGELTQLQLKRHVYADAAIKLEKPAALQLSVEHASVAPLCLSFTEKQLCLQGDWKKTGDWQLRLDGDELPMHLFDLEGADAPHFDGSWGAHLTAAAEPNKVWTANGRLLLKDAQLSYKPLQAALETFRIGSGQLDLNAAKDEITALLSVRSEDHTSVEANAHLDRRNGEDLLRMPLRAQVRAHSDEIQLLPVLFADIDRAAGVIDADMNVTGTLAEPELGGTIKLHDGELDFYQINLALRAMQLNIQLASNQLIFGGQARAGDGSLAVDGTLAWTNNAPHGTLTFKGEDLLVADLPDYRVVASPDLKFAIDGRKVDVTGELTIPSARIQPKDLRGAKQVSSDARLMNEARSDKASSITAQSDVKVIMGKDVQINAFGLQGQLGGSVDTIVRGDYAVGRGELSVTNGKYEAYGQKLDITRGRLLLDATPLDDPGLDIAAERKKEEENITVGVNVRGTLHSPRLSFYSDPSMTQSKILSYLVTGASIEDSQSSTAKSGSAGSSIAMQGGGYLASKLGEQIGLQQVGIESTATNGSALVLGRFLSPRLFVSYGISLTEAINTLKLRYTLNDHWTIKTEHGSFQSVDFEYTIEK